MKPLTAEYIAEAVNGSLIRGSGEAVAAGVSTNTREIRENEVFFALQGEKSDGHIYVKNAWEKGCRIAVVSKDIPELEGMTVIKTEDTLKALQSLAKQYLRDMPGLIKAGITGSVGKTSTKELLYWSLCGKYRTAKNIKNFNNHIGMPLTALSVEPEHQAAIFEMGMGNFGEVDLLADIARPEIAVITNIGVSHISELGSRENILKAKLEITNYFDESSKLVVNADNDLLSAVNWDEKNYKVIRVGRSDDCDYVIKNIENLAEDGSELTLKIGGKDYLFHIPLLGSHNSENAALAIAAAVELGTDPETIAETIAQCEDTEKRLVESISEDGIKVIDDTYNASPDSMRSGMDVLGTVSSDRKIVIFGDMLGMGEDTEKFHRQVGEYAGRCGMDLVLTVGKDAEFISDSAGKLLGADRVRHFEDKEALIKELDGLLEKGDAVLIKASRAMGMEKIAEYILKDRS